MHLKGRSEPRSQFDAITEICDLDQSQELVAVSRDLSVSGCFVKTTTPFPKETRVRVRIQHSGEDFVAIGNVTENVTETGMGIVFTQIEPNDRALLARWLGR